MSHSTQLRNASILDLFKLLIQRSHAIKIDGHSMEPTLKAGAAVCVTPQTTYAKDDIIVFTKDRTYIKRITEKSKVYTAQGDNEAHSKTYTVQPEEIIGKVTAII